MQHQNHQMNKYQFWQHNNKPIELWCPKVTQEKINYVHNNPVEAGLVYHITQKIISIEVPGITVGKKD